MATTRGEQLGTKSSHNPPNIHYYPRLLEKRRGSSFCIHGIDFYKTMSAEGKSVPLGGGSYGQIYEITDQNNEYKNIFIVKEVSFDFYNRLRAREDYAGKTEQEVRASAKTLIPNEVADFKSEVSLFEQRYGYARLFHNEGELTARALLLRLPGHQSDTFYFKHPQQVLRVWILALIEVHFLHSKYGIIHGDLKWSNFIYDEKNGRIYICDFGLSRRTDELTSGKYSKRYHLHPKLEKQVPADPRHDIFSLGQMLLAVDENWECQHRDISNFKVKLTENALHDIYLGMIELSSDKQWSLETAINESIKIYNDNLPHTHSCFRMNVDLSTYQPSPAPKLPKSLIKSPLTPSTAHSISSITTASPTSAKSEDSVPDDHAIYSKSLLDSSHRNPKDMSGALASTAVASDSKEEKRESSPIPDALEKRSDIEKDQSDSRLSQPPSPLLTPSLGDHDVDELMTADIAKFQSDVGELPTNSPSLTRSNEKDNVATFMVDAKSMGQSVSNVAATKSSKLVDTREGSLVKAASSLESSSPILVNSQQTNRFFAPKNEQSQQHTSVGGVQRQQAGRDDQADAAVACGRMCVIL